MLTLYGQGEELSRGYLKLTNSPIDYATWIGPGGELLMAADFVLDTRILLYPPKEAAPLPARSSEQLVLLTASVAYWDKAFRPH
jgi:hypothetical protein